VSWDAEPAQAYSTAAKDPDVEFIRCGAILLRVPVPAGVELLGGGYFYLPV
jgi:hypothetical protein